MNAERLHAIALVLNQEMTKNHLIEKLQELISALSNVVSQQQHPQHQQTLANNLKALYSALTDSPSDSFSPAWSQLLSEIGGYDLFGNELRKGIQNIFERNQITPAVALSELQQLQKQISSFKNGLDQLISSFRQFKIGDEKLSPGECEIGMLIPRKAVDNSLTEFADELKELAFILNTLSEVSTGKKGALSIKTISSSDLMVYLDAIIPFAACLSVAIERIVALYKQILEIRKLHSELAKQGVPEEQTSSIKDYANTLMGNGVEKLSVEIVEKFCHSSDKERKNELVTATKISLNRIANRIDRGYNLEVRVEPMEKPSQEDKGRKEVLEKIQIIQAATKNMQFMKIDGPPILCLPESKEKMEEDKEKTPPRRKIPPKQNK